MSTPSVYDTPRDGDFARYVEELGRHAAARVHEGGGMVPTALPVPPARRAGPRTAQPAADPIPVSALTSAQAVFAPLRGLLKFGVVLWIAYTVGAALFPGLAVIGWPLLIFFVVAGAARLKSLPWAALAQAARREAEQKIQRPPSRPQ